MTFEIKTVELPDWMKNADGRLATFLPSFPVENGELHFLVPSGIGDVAWIWAKMWKLAEDRDVTFWFPDDPVKRVEGYANLVGMKHGYTNIDIRDLLAYPGEFTEKDLENGGIWYCHANRHIEEGRPLHEGTKVYREGKWKPSDTWMSWLPFRNPAPCIHDVKREDAVWKQHTNLHVAEHQGTVKEPYIVMHLGSASYCEGNWFPRVWARTVAWIEENIAPVMLMGAAWDEPMIEAVYKVYKPSILPCVRHPFHKALTDIVNSVGMIGVDSGLTIMATYMGLPALRLYPRWLHKMASGTFEDEATLHPHNKTTFMDMYYDEYQTWCKELKDKYIG